MTTNALPHIVYHGTLSIHKSSLIKGIDISKGYPSTDFGQGFYTTENYIQAKDIAIGRAKAYLIKEHTEAVPMIITYDLNLDLLERNKGKVFKNDEFEQWKEFVYNNRVGLNYIVSSLHNLNHKYDYVYGAVADSKIIDMTREIKKGSIDFGVFTDHLKALKGGTYSQLSFHSNEAVKALNMVNIECIKREELLTI